MYPRRTRKPWKKPAGAIRPTGDPSAEELELFVTFVNAASGGGAALQSPRSLGDWLARHSLAAVDEEIPASGPERVRQVCAALRGLIAGSDTVDDGAAERELARLASTLTLRPRFGADGTTWLEPGSAGLDGLVETVFAIVVRARFENRWARFKLCADGECGRVFYDTSRRLGALWCSPRCRSRCSSRHHRQRGGRAGS